MLCLYLSNVKSHVLNFKVLRDYFVIKQNKNNKTKTPLRSTSLGMDQNNSCTSQCIHSSWFGIKHNHRLDKEHLKIVAFLFPKLSPSFSHHLQKCSFSPQGDKNRSDMLPGWSEEDKYVKIIQMKLNKLIYTFTNWRVFKLVWIK